MEGCLSCDLIAGRRDLPGGIIAQTQHWCVEHCVGPFPLGTLIVVPVRHVAHPWELSDEESLEFGPTLQRAAAACHELCQPEQVYISQWTHSPSGNWHIHYVVQPVPPLPPDAPRAAHLQAATFDAEVYPERTAVEAFCEHARSVF